MPYRLKRPPILETLELRGLRFQLYRWPGEDPRPFVFVHGWGDSGETFQFLVDELSLRHTIVSFDARGFGRTQWPQDGYWFPDYIADLEALLDVIAPHDSVDLLGHSMGGNVAMIYAGVRSQRVRHLISLEGFGLQATTPEQAPEHYANWLDEIKTGTSFSTYNDFEQFARVLARRNPRTSADAIEFIAQSWGQQRADGRIELRSDPRHKRANPVLYQRTQAESCWRAITAPLLFVLGGQSELAKRILTDESLSHLVDLFPKISVERLHDAGHMVHHEQPLIVAELIEQFLR